MMTKIWTIRAIPTYRVYRLYDTTVLVCKINVNVLRSTLLTEVIYKPA